MLEKAQTILVTGGCGFVGSWLVRELLERTKAEKIVVLDNLCNGRRDFLPESERVVLQDVDLRDKPAVEDVIAESKPEVIFHLAALHFIPYCNAHPAETLDVNVVGTQHLLDACARQEPASLVAVSSAAVYPIRDEANVEDDPGGPSDIYGLSKWVNEKQLEQFAARAGTRCAAVRLFNVIGPHETNPHVLPAILEQLGRGETEIALGNVKPRRDYVYVTDVAEALVDIAAKNRRSFRIYNVGGGHEHSVEEIVARLAELSGLPLTIRTASDRVRPSDRMHLLADLTRIREEIGWRPRHDLRAGLAALWQSWRASRPGNKLPQQFEGLVNARA